MGGASGSWPQPSGYPLIPTLFGYTSSGSLLRALTRSADGDGAVDDRCGYSISKICLSRTLTVAGRSDETRRSVASASSVASPGAALVAPAVRSTRPAVHSLHVYLSLYTSYTQITGLVSTRTPGT